MADIFLSYSHKDTDFMHRLRNDLQAAEGPIRYRNVLGGIIRDYYREDA